MPVESVDQYIETHPEWKEELHNLRTILNGFALEECIKWGAPVYTLNGKNLIGIAAFKNHCALWFFNGALLRKNTALLQNAQQEKTKALRQIRFIKDQQIKPEVLCKYVFEAIQNHKEGKEIKPVIGKKVVIPIELKEAMENDEELKKSFLQLPKGKQREYVDYITTAKREATKESRLNKIKPMIITGIGLQDKYRNG